MPVELAVRNQYYFWLVFAKPTFLSGAILCRLNQPSGENWRALILNQTTKPSRRSFLNIGAGAAAAAGLSEVLSPGSLAASSPARAVVCIYLVGGNDSNNLIVPLDSPAYDAYASARGPLAIPRSDLLSVQSGPSARYGFHPNLPGLRDLYNQSTLAVLANVGRRAAPGAIPPEYFLHTSMQVRFVPNGYMAIPWAAPAAVDPGKLRIKRLTHGVTMAAAETVQARGESALRALGSNRDETPFPGDRFGQRLASVFAALRAGSFRQQAFLVPFDGFDTHARQLERQANLFTDLNNGLVAFYGAIRDMGMAQSVTIYTDTEFNRTLRPNSAGGSEHGWGGHQLILGGSTLGGRIYGNFPSMVVGGVEDAAGNGTWFPTTSNTEYAATVAAWYGKYDLLEAPEYANDGGPVTRLDFLTQ